ncbi:MAG TPA: MarR family transcriptional regulator [Solirubrobacteraceae bacterium]|jgi:DNA-binding MarR family transcriptional regulator
MPSESERAVKRTRSQALELERQQALAELASNFRHVFRTLSRMRGRDTHLSSSDVSHAQFELLVELYERGPLSAGELAAAAQLTPATVTQMLEHLAESGHVERSRSDTDKRVVVSCLTAFGRGKIEAKRAAWQARWQEVLDGVEVEQLRAASGVLERLCGLFEDAPGSGECATGRAGKDAAQVSSQTS